MRSRCGERDVRFERVDSELCSVRFALSGSKWLAGGPSDRSASAFGESTGAGTGVKAGVFDGELSFEFGSVKAAAFPAWLEFIPEAVIPLAACAYEKAGAATAGSFAGLLATPAIRPDAGCL